MASTQAHSVLDRARDHGQGGELYGWCTTKSQYAACYRYLEEVIDTNQALEEGTPMENRICIPDGVAREQLRQIVVKKLTEDVEVRQRPAAGLVWRALLDVWPCRWRDRPTHGEP